VDVERMQKRPRHAYLDVRIDDLDAAIDQALELEARGVAKSIGVLCNATELLERLKSARSCPTCSPTRPARTTRSAATCRTA
jgi:urocanate hydratase